MKHISWKSLAVITLGTLLFALTLNIFLIPNHMGEGGVTGLSLMLFYAIGIPIDITYFLINFILLIIGFKYLERSTLFYTIYALVAMTIFIRVTQGYTYVFQDTFLTPIVTGVLAGISLGFIMLAGGSTAGTDIIALIINRYLHIPTGVALFIIDLFIIGPSAFIIGFEKTIYTLIMLIITIKIIDYILEGLNPKKSIMIISPHYQQIATEIMTKVERGITILDGHGYYTSEKKQIVYIIVSRAQVIEITKIVNHIDPKAFMTVSDVHKVSGEGFTFHLTD